MNIETIYMASIRKPKENKAKSLDEIIDSIRCGSHRSNVHALRSESDKDVRRKLKLELPAFMPALKSKEPLIPNGLVQFDIDTKGNEGIDFEKLGREVTKNPYVLYCFRSPNNGLKLAVKTDFENTNAQDEQTSRRRFENAYSITKNVLREHLGESFRKLELDDSVKSIQQLCFVSDDPNAYWNQNCQTLKINDQTDVVCTIEKNENYPVATTSQIEELLSHIPRDFNYQDRLKVNMAVLNSIGADGISLLESHWNVSDREKLKRDLVDQLRHSKFGSVGYLYNLAVKHGYQPPSRAPSTITLQAAQKSDYVFPKPLSVESANLKLKNAISVFFESQTPKSTLINVSTGHGKTEAVLKALVDLSHQKKVLYLVANHELGEEICSRFEEIKKKQNGEIELENTGKSEFEQLKLKSKAGVKHIYGKDHSKNGGESFCQNSDALKAFGKSGDSIPLMYCTSACKHSGSCNYTRQFSTNFRDNILVMTHNEFVGTSSAWLGGVQELPPYEAKPFTYRSSKTDNEQRNTYIPDYIVVDEKWIASNFSKAGLDTTYTSIKNIVSKCLSDTTLEEAVRQCSDQIILDYTKMLEEQDKNPYISGADDKALMTPEEYILANGQKSKLCPVLSLLNDVVKKGFDQTAFGMLTFDEKNLCLRVLEHTKVQANYQHIPTLFLDATADESVYREVTPELEVVNIQVEASPNINVYQLENYNWTKKNCADIKKREDLVHSINHVTQRYDTIGLITYKSLQGIDNFDQWLASEICASVYDHFGNVRGSNKFETVDCLVVVGRHMLPPCATKDLCSSIFKDFQELSDANSTMSLEVPIRMKDGTAMTLWKNVDKAPQMQAVARHFAESETIQAIGRARLIHGSPKDVYLFSNEGLGGAIEVTGFFRYERDLIPAINKLISVGYVRDKRSDFTELGVSEHFWKERKDVVIQQIIAAGAKTRSLKVRTPNRNTSERTYYIIDDDKFELHLRQENLTVVS